MVLLSFATLLVVDLVQSWSPNATADVTGVSSAGSDTAGQRTAGRALPDGSRVLVACAALARLTRGRHVRRSAKHGSCAADTPTSKPSHFAQLDAHNSTQPLPKSRSHGMASPCGKPLLAAERE